MEIKPGDRRTGSIWWSGDDSPGGSRAGVDKRRGGHFWLAPRGRGDVFRAGAAQPFEVDIQRYQA